MSEKTEAKQTIAQVWSSLKHRKPTREELRVNRMGTEDFFDYVFPIKCDETKAKTIIDKKFGGDISVRKLKMILNIVKQEHREEERKNPIFEDMIGFRDELGLTNMEAYRLTNEYYYRLIKEKPADEDATNMMWVRIMCDFIDNWDKWMDELPLSVDRLNGLVQSMKKGHTDEKPEEVHTPL